MWCVQSTTTRKRLRFCVLVSDELHDDLPRQALDNTEEKSAVENGVLLQVLGRADPNSRHVLRAILRAFDAFGTSLPYSSLRSQSFVRRAC
jgi:hypothetical protein